MKTLTNRRIRKIHATLSILSSRMLPSQDSEKKVSTLLRRYFGEAHEVTDDLIRTIRERNPVPDDLDGTQLPTAILEKRQREIDTMNDQEQEIRDVPAHLLIEDKDFPRSFKHHEDNAMGVADLRNSLDFLYPIPLEEDASDDARPTDDRPATA